MKTGDYRHRWRGRDSWRWPAGPISKAAPRKARVPSASATKATGWSRKSGTAAPKSGEYTVVVGKRFMVEVQGNAGSLADLKAAASISGPGEAGVAEERRREARIASRITAYASRLLARTLVDNQIGFHESVVNPLLVSHFAALGMPKARTGVPAPLWKDAGYRLAPLAMDIASPALNLASSPWRHFSIGWGSADHRKLEVLR